MLAFAGLAAIDWVAVCKTAAVVIVALTFLGICLRAVFARPGDVRRGASMPLEDLPESHPKHRT